MGCGVMSFTFSKTCACAAVNKNKLKNESINVFTAFVFLMNDLVSTTTSENLKIVIKKQKKELPTPYICARYRTKPLGLTQSILSCGHVH